MQLPNRQMIILGSVAIVMVILVVIFSLAKKPGQSTVEPGANIDPTSGEQVSDPAGRVHETYGTDADEPTFLGVDELLSAGLTKYQLADYKQAMTSFNKTRSSKYSEVSVKKDSVIKPPLDQDNNSDKHSMTFIIVCDRKDTYTVRVLYYDLSAIELTLLDSANKSVFQSGVIDQYSGGD